MTKVGQDTLRGNTVLPESQGRYSCLKPEIQNHNFDYCYFASLSQFDIKGHNYQGILRYKAYKNYSAASIVFTEIKLHKTTY